MTVIEAHFFAPDDINGSTIFECSTDDSFVKRIKLDIQRDSLGSGELNFARKVGVGLISRDIVAPDVLIRYLIPAVDPTKYLWGNFIKVRQQRVVSKAEKGGEGFTFAGPGPKLYLTRQLLWSASFAGYGSAVEKEAGLWTWPASARAGAILNRLFIEDAANPTGPFLPGLTNSFNDNDDSNGDPWTDDISEGNEDFTLKIQDDYLKILWKLEDAAGFVTQIDLGEVGDPQLRLDAYQTFGRDLTGDLAFDTAHFIEGVNIADDMDVDGESFRKASHALMRGNDGLYELSARPGADEFKRVIGGSYDTNSPTVLDNAGVRLLQRQEAGEDQPKLTIVPGFLPGQGLYLPGPDGTNGHIWLGDSVSVTTGQSAQTALDYDGDTGVITGIQLETVDAVSDDSTTKAARSFEVGVTLNEERKNSETQPSRTGSRGASPATPSDLKWCRPGTIGAGVDFLGLVGAVCTSVGSNFASDHPAWSGDNEERVSLLIDRDIPVGHALIAITGVQQANWNAEPDTVYDEQGNAWVKDAEHENTGSSSDDTVQIWRCNVTDALSAGDYIRSAVNLGSSLDPASETGGRCIEVIEFSTTLTVATVGTGAGTFSSTPSISTPAGDVVIAGICAAKINGADGDWLTIGPEVHVGGSGALESGVYAQYLLEGGATTWTPSLSANDDWAARAVSYTAAVGETNVREGHPDLVGAVKRLVHCDHRHDVIRDVDPTEDDDWDTQGYSVGTLWVVVDDLGSPTEVISEWRLLDQTTGAAVWVQVGPSGGGSGGVPTPKWIDPAGGNALVNAQTHSANNRGVIRPVMILGPCTITKIRINISVSNGTLSCGVYDSSFARLGTSGSVASPGTGWQDITLSTPVVITTPGLYWFGFSASGTTISVFTMNLAGSSAEFCYLMETAHPLPATFTPGAASRGPVMIGILSGGIT